MLISTEKKDVERASKRKGGSRRVGASKIRICFDNTVPIIWLKHWAASKETSMATQTTPQGAQVVTRRIERMEGGHLAQGEYKRGGGPGDIKTQTEPSLQKKKKANH